MGSVAVGAMVIGTSMLVVFALAITSLENQVDESIAQIEASAQPVPDFTIANLDFLNVSNLIMSSEIISMLSIFSFFILFFNIS